MTALSPPLESLPEGVADLELNARIDARIAVAERSRGDVDSVHSQIDGTFRTNEVMGADAALGRKVPHTGSPVDPWDAIDRRRALNIRRIFVRCIDETPRPLKPGLKAARMTEEVPAQDYRGQADSAKGPAAEG